MMNVTNDLPVRFSHQISLVNLTHCKLIFNSLVQTYYIKNIYHAGINIGFLISTYVSDCQKFYISINYCSIVSFEQNNW